MKEPSGKGKIMFIKTHMSRNIHLPSRTQAFVAFELFTITQINTLERTKTEFVGLIRTNTREAGTTKNTKVMVIGLFVKQNLIW